MSVPNTLPSTLTCFLDCGTENNPTSTHLMRSQAEKWIIDTLKRSDVEETRNDYIIQMYPTKATFTRKGKV